MAVFRHSSAQVAQRSVGNGPTSNSRAHANTMAKAGEDTEFYKDAQFLIPIERGPFYAFEMIPAWYSTLCGVKIDGETRVLGADDQPIPGLYAGGLDSGEFFKDNYNHGFSGGCSGYSYFTGLFAADRATAYIKEG
ncbi:MAG: FAD-binding protein [Bifidobacteriaceae bacterium]|nr:FAD-binding protein [Bifidobacteriaceae bacterium]